MPDWAQDGAATWPLKTLQQALRAMGHKTQQKGHVVAVEMRLIG
jgi:hypothetical protein